MSLCITYNAGSSDEFIKAYITAAQAAIEFAAPDTELKTAGINTALKGQTNRITLKISFTLGDKTEFNIELMIKKAKRP